MPEMPEPGNAAQDIHDRAVWLFQQRNLRFRRQQLRFERGFFLSWITLIPAVSRF